jgi:hypothetical protein
MVVMANSGLPDVVESEVRRRGCVSDRPIEGVLMTNAQPDCSEVCVAPPPAVIAALRDRYIVSSAAAQRGAYALEVRDAHWRALARGIQEAKAVLDPQIATRETHATALLRQLASMCEDLLDRHAMGQECPPAAWREIGRFGRDAYECFNLNVTGKTASDA